MSEIVLDEKREKSLIVPVLLFALAVLYDISPVDIIPDIPVLGWVDDFFITVTAGLNLLQKSVVDTNRTLSAIFGLLKWGILFLGVMMVSLVGLGVFAVFKLMSN